MKAAGHAPTDMLTLKYNTVLSDVHLLRPGARHLMTRLNGSGQPVFRSRFRFLTDRDSTTFGPRRGDTDDGGEEDTADTPDQTGLRTTPVLDEDGDFDVSHRPRKKPEHEVISPIILHQSDGGLVGPLHQDDNEDAPSMDVLTIEHTMATPLEDVGKQVWRGAFLLADFILSDPARFAGATVVDLGAGTGVSSVVMAMTAGRVFSTDVGTDLLSMCRSNVALNAHLTSGEVVVRHLDWLQTELRTDAELEFSWTEEDLLNMYGSTTVVMAADVCYDDESTEALFRTLSRLCSRFGRLCSIFISIEKRLNFSLRHLDVACEAYDHFRRCLSQLAEQGPFSVRRLDTHFPQALQYERVQQLELWEVTAEPRSAAQ